ncbi:MAG TPA: peptidoglycan-binding domain-containing protein, partial [Burkholderiales bacterium]|nr:peptidoglycan-binding domain-containing protein [Burkholderiales bacterium]
YETVTERVLVKPAVWAWKKASEGARSDITRVDPSTGEVLCLVEVPAQYETITKQVVKTPATTREREIPPVYKTVERQVLKTPATTREVQVPAEYTTVKVQKMVEPAREQRVAVPAQYETVQRTVLASPAKEEWRQVLCEVNSTPENIRALQDALRAAGYDPGPSTGELNAATMRALRQYQAARNLPVDPGQYVNMATVQALGVQAGTPPATAQTGASESSPSMGEVTPPTETQSSQQPNQQESGQQ